MVRLEPVAQFRGLRALTWRGDTLYASSGYRVYGLRPGRATPWEPVTCFRPVFWRYATARLRLAARLFRDGFHALAVLDNGRIVGVLPGAIAMARSMGGSMQATCRVARGTRPLALAVTPDGNIFWGEYFSNLRREQVHVYGSFDGGETWRIVYTFPSGSIRHVHGITYDRFDDCLWVLTGDEDQESAILRASTDWRSVERVVGGSQQTRAVTIQPMPHALYFATDTPMEGNRIYRLDRSGTVHPLAPISGSCFWSAQSAGMLFFSTAVEASRVNTSRIARLYGGTEEDGWHELVAWESDGFPDRLFQYGNILFPTGENTAGLLAATGVAVKGHDGVTHVWRVSAA